MAASSETAFGRGVGRLGAFPHPTRSLSLPQGRPRCLRRDAGEPLVCPLFATRHRRAGPRTRGVRNIPVSAAWGSGERRGASGPARSSGPRGSLPGSSPGAFPTQGFFLVGVSPSFLRENPSDPGPLPPEPHSSSPCACGPAAHGVVVQPLHRRTDQRWIGLGFGRAWRAGGARCAPAAGGFPDLQPAAFQLGREVLVATGSLGGPDPSATGFWAISQERRGRPSEGCNAAARSSHAREPEVPVWIPCFFPRTLLRGSLVLPRVRFPGLNQRTDVS